MPPVVVPGPVDSASAPPSLGCGNYLPTQSQASYHSAPSSPSARRCSSSGFDGVNEELQANVRANAAVVDGHADVCTALAKTLVCCSARTDIGMPVYNGESVIEITTAGIVVIVKPMTRKTMPTTVISMTLSAKSSALHSESRLFSNLISLLALSTSMSTSPLALAFSLPLPPSPLPFPLLLLLLLLGSPSKIQEFSLS